MKCSILSLHRFQVCFLLLAGLMSCPTVWADSALDIDTNEIQADSTFHADSGEFCSDSSLTALPSDTLPSPSQETKKGPWLKRAVKAAGTFLDKLAISGVDTNYLALPKYGWKVPLSVNFAGIHCKVEGHELPVFSDVSSSIRSSLNGHASIGIGYRSLSFKYSWDLSHNYSRDVNFSLLDNPYGIEIRSHVTDGFHGHLDASSTEGDMDIRKGDLRLKATLINAYVAFNSKHYSLPAAMDQSLIQRRSAGSVTAHVLFLSSELTANNQALLERLSGLKRIEVYQAAAGIGYGYNYTPNQGRLLLHLSAAPLLVFFTKNFMTASIPLPIDEEEVLELELNSEVKTKHKYFLTAIMRASAFYNINDHFYLGATALLNNIRFDSEEDVKLQMKDWIVNAQFGIRF